MLGQLVAQVGVEGTRTVDGTPGLCVGATGGIDRGTGNPTKTPINTDRQRSTPQAGAQLRHRDVTHEIGALRRHGPGGAGLLKVHEAMRDWSSDSTPMLTDRSSARITPLPSTTSKGWQVGMVKQRLVPAMRSSKQASMKDECRRLCGASFGPDKTRGRIVAAIVRDCKTQITLQ